MILCQPLCGFSRRMDLKIWDMVRTGVRDRTNTLVRESIGTPFKTVAHGTPRHAMPASHAQEDVGGAAAPGGDGAQAGEEDAAHLVPGGPKHPIQFVQLDPGADWLCGTTVLQPELAWVAQLERSRDVVAQSLAVKGGWAGTRQEGERAVPGGSPTWLSLSEGGRARGDE